MRPASLVELLSEASRALQGRPTPVTLLVDFACLELGRDDGSLLRTLLEVPHDPGLSAAGHQLVLIFRTALPPPELSTQPGWAVVEVGLPDSAERRHVLSYAGARQPVPMEQGLELEGVAVTLGGLDADGLLRLASEAREYSALSTVRVTEVKTEEIRRIAGDTLVVDSELPPTEIAGLANLRLHVQRRLAAGIPIGTILLAGVPGVGKTYAFRYLAHHLGLPAVRLGQLRGPFVGQTEQNWGRARRVLEATAPSVVLADEADQIGLGRRGMDLDSGVSSRLRAEIFDLLNSCEELGIVFCLTTNNPAGIDPAGLDRLRTFPVLHPGVDEAVQIMGIAARRRGWELDTDEARSVLAARAELLTGRQLVRLLEDAACRAALDGHPAKIGGEDVRAEAARSIGPVDNLAHEYMALSALALATSLDALPWVAAAALGEQGDLPPYLVPMVGRDGCVDMTRVGDRLSELQRTGHGFYN